MYIMDSYNRKVEYLRVSVTSRCNFRCQYCMPTTPFSWVPKEDLLSYEEMFEFIKLGIDNGIKKVRITGGEPLIREELHLFIKMIKSYAPNIDLSLTTNGYFLSDTAHRLKDAGLDRINISLDSLDASIAKTISQKDTLSTVLDGISQAKSVGLKIKLNSVILKGINESQIFPLLEYGKENGFIIRFIEFMENSHATSDIVGLTAGEIKEIVSSMFELEPSINQDSSSPAKYYSIDGYEFGIIEPHKDDFCKSCNRVRLSATGDLIPCLYFEDSLNIKASLEQKDFEKTLSIFKQVMENKPEKNRWSLVENENSSRAFYETGG
jgi:cyclic pyranopterin phosphate synthase